MDTRAQWLANYNKLDKHCSPHTSIHLVHIVVWLWVEEDDSHLDREVRREGAHPFGLLSRRGLQAQLS